MAAAQPPGDVTVIGALPTTPEGAAQSNTVVVVESSVAGAPPTETVVPGRNPLPTMKNCPPPDAGPDPLK